MTHTFDVTKVQFTDLDGTDLKTAVEKELKKLKSMIRKYNTHQEIQQKYQ